MTLMEYNNPIYMQSISDEYKKIQELDPTFFIVVSNIIGFLCNFILLLIDAMNNKSRLSVSINIFIVFSLLIPLIQSLIIKHQMDKIIRHIKQDVNIAY